MKNATSRFKATVTSPLGTLLLAASTQGLAGVWFSNQRHRPSEGLIHSWPTDASNPVLQATAQQLSRYWEGGLNRFDLPLDLSDGTLFQQSVWSALCAIPPGQTLRYGELASQIGRPAAVRAVGTAIGRNPLSIVVPCHRVVGADGSLTGYAGGLDRKAALLRLEQGGGLFSPPSPCHPA
ncbi:MAG: methylated-DNA--[protein]-cysteine S-methyltransferase [Hydrogenophaga sp.]|uniref:methylated-DNA--[protein]-cysteine S-methyltransferase n=1 Tax=Hydrogenophaga sp. TaxID=1904254 RepID=UPI002721476C|nr:methylated-DNA--[protein]-cysteine S-methyltransferase [Hydrogenophaga sp.]MDO9149194.1 methylated-DNA--[protein]-cysteine S-methyltransferase [Hydrogenophaga sp.]MDO9606164.1 methylated-DNA--[protein]-cysteine S-methyltransferase [Hydrogenophaga sp.]MDP2163899.1 methylated-DNA--[protein]-cysteine S-methyltransferase [Hydrogenophaga sp.]MDP3476085.1 methylated-DNA--[protein]-cysteine S-methyltransferase [Hydrogenophaga sp.]